MRRFARFFGDDFRIEHPTGSDTELTLGQIADELDSRLIRICLADESGRRPVFGDDHKLNTDPV